MNLSAVIRAIPNHPKPGVMFRDITTLLGDAAALRYSVDALTQAAAGQGVTKVAGTEARGFILGGAVAHQLGAGFIPLRKKGKLPHLKIGVDYDLEYGADTLEMHLDACAPGERIFLIDDLIATGGTAIAAIQLFRQIGALAVGAAFVIDLPDLGGAERLRTLGVPVTTLVSFDGE